MLLLLLESLLVGAAIAEAAEVTAGAGYTGTANAMPPTLGLCLLATGRCRFRFAFIFTQTFLFASIFI